MPNFAYRCQDCGREYDHFYHNRNHGETHPCPDCGRTGKRLMGSGSKYKVKTGDFFEPYLEEDLGETPVLIKSKDHFFDECRKRGFEPRAMPERLK